MVDVRRNSLVIIRHKYFRILESNYLFYTFFFVNRSIIKIKNILNVYVHVPGRAGSLRKISKGLGPGPTKQWMASRRLLGYKY